MSSFLTILGKHLVPSLNNMLLAGSYDGTTDGFITPNDICNLAPFLTQAEIEALPGFGAGGGAGNTAFFQDKKAIGINGGTFTAGAYRVRDITEISYDSSGLLSLSLNQLTIPAGVYFCDISCPAYNVNYHVSWLHDVTNDVVLALGSSEFASTAANVSSCSRIMGAFELSVESVVEIRHQCWTTNTSTGFGVANLMQESIYTQGVLQWI